MIPWERFEEKYATLFSEENGAPAKPFRMALGALIIRQEKGLSDEETVQEILESPYLQYFIGLHEFTTKSPFAPTMMVYFRKRITPEIMKEINDEMFTDPANPPDDDQLPPGNTNNENSANKGTIKLDATCTPANITYPTDVGLLNEAREKLEDMIDVLHSFECSKKRNLEHIVRLREENFSFFRKIENQVTKLSEKPLDNNFVL